MSKTIIICLTPVKNEAWILDRFLKCASMWADYIFIADQRSTDGSREIARSHPKVILIDNPSLTFNEPERQKMLIQAAREIPGQRLLVALDADEFLTANFMHNPEWDAVLEAPPGTVIKFQWANLLPDMHSYWTPDYDFPWGFMDDGSPHVAKDIHSPRVPVPDQGLIITLRDIRVLHYQYTDWPRMKSKQRWYQCWERLKFPSKSAIDLYREYHHMDVVPQSDIRPIPEKWLSGYELQGIDMISIPHEEFFWWDKEILLWFDRYGTKTFRKEAIWDVDWQALAKKINLEAFSNDYRDPRSLLEKLLHFWLEKTQTSQPRNPFSVRLITKLLKFLKWG